MFFFIYIFKSLGHSAFFFKLQVMSDFVTIIHGNHLCVNRHTVMAMCFLIQYGTVSSILVLIVVLYVFFITCAVWVAVSLKFTLHYLSF